MLREASLRILSELHEDGLSYPASDSVRSTFLSHKLDLNPETKLFDSPVAKARKVLISISIEYGWIVEPYKTKKLHFRDASSIQNLNVGANMARHMAQMRRQMLVPDLYVFTLKFLAYK